MAEEGGEPLEVLSVGIEADIHALIEGVHEGVAQAAEELTQIPPAKIEADTTPLDLAIQKFFDLKVSAAEAAEVIEQGSREGASSAERFAASIAELKLLPEFRVHFSGLVEGLDLSAGTLQSALEVFSSFTTEVDRLIGSFEALDEIPIEQTTEVIRRALEGTATSTEQLAASILEYAQRTEMGLSAVVESMLGAKLITETQAAEVASFLGSLGEAGTKAFDPMIQKAVYAIDKFREFGLTVAQVVGIINQGMDENATAIERTAGTVLQHAISQFRELKGAADDLVGVGVIDEQSADAALGLLSQLGTKYEATAQGVRDYTAALMEAQEAARGAQLEAKGLGESVGQIEELVAALDQIRLTEEQITQIQVEQMLGPLEQLTSDVVYYAVQSEQSLGEAAQHFVELGQIGAEELAGIQTHILSTISFLQMMGETAPSAAEGISEVNAAWVSVPAEPLEKVVQALNEITLNAEQTRIALDFTDEVHEGIANLVESANTLGVSLGEAGRQFAMVGDESIESLQRTAEFLQNLVDLTDPIGELVIALNQIQLTPEQISNIYLEEIYSSLGKLTAEVVRYSEQSGQSLGDAAQHFVELGQVGAGELIGIQSRIKDVIDFLKIVDETVSPVAQGFEETGETAVQAIGGVVEIFHTLTEQMLHARPASVFAAAMRQMGEEVAVTFKDVEANAQSMLALLTLGVPEGGEIKITVDAEDAVQTLARVEQALVDAQLITTYATHSLEELGDLPLGPQLSYMEKRLQAVVEGLDQVSLSGEQVASILEGAPWETTAALMQNVVNYSRDMGVSLGEAATVLHGMGEIGIQNLEQVLERLQGTTRSLGEFVEETQQATEETQAFSARMAELAEAFEAVAFKMTFPQAAALIEQGADAVTGSLEANAAAIMAITQGVGLSLGELAGVFSGLGMSFEDLEAVLQHFETTATEGLKAPEESVESLRQATQGLGEEYYNLLNIASLMAGKSGDLFSDVSQDAGQATQALEGTVDVFFTLTEQMLHGRPAGVLSASFQQMGEDIKVTFEEIEANAQSILSLISLGVPKGAEIKVTVDAANAVETIEQVKQALVSANLITQEATHSLTAFGAAGEELGQTAVVRTLGEIVVGFGELGKIPIEQMVGVINQGLESTATTAERVAGTILELSVVQRQAIQEAMVSEWHKGLVSEEDFDKALTFLQDLGIKFRATGEEVDEFKRKVALVRRGLRSLADTHINPSPLKESIDNIIDRLGVLADQAKSVVQDILKINGTRLGGEEFMGRLGIVPPEAEKTVSLMERLKATLGALAERGRTAFEGLIGGLGRTQEALGVTQLSAEQLNQIFQAATKESATDVERLTSMVVKLSQASGESFQSVVKGMTENKTITKDAGSAVVSALGKVTGASGGLASVIGSLGTVASSVFGGIIGILGVNSLKKIIAKLQEATKETILFQAAVVRLSVGMRAAQRLMGDQIGTIAGWKDHIQELGQTYSVFSRTALTQAASQIIMLTREMRLNETEVQQALEAATTLAAIYQIDLQQAIRLVIQGMTGMSRGLRRYGVFLSRAALNQKAYQMGLEDTWRELTVNERAQVSLALIMDQTTPMVEDLGHMLETMAGRLQAVEASTEDAKVAIGRLMTPLKVIAAETGVKFLEFLGKAATSMVMLVTMAARTAAMMWEFGKALAEGVGLEEAAERAMKAGEEIFLSWSRAFALIGPGLEDVEEATLGIGDDFDEQAQALLDMAHEYGDKIEDAFQDYHRAVEEAGIKLREDLADQAKKLQRDLLDAYEDYLDDLEDLQREYDRKLADQTAEDRDRLAELEREYELRRIKLREDHLNTLLELQEKYQVDSRRLRDRFIETLRDAIAKRDAWAALKAIRQYATDRRELKEDYDLKRTQKERDFQLRMRDLERKLAEERRKLLEAQKEEAADLALWLARKREDLAIDYNRELEDLHLSNTRKEEELQRSYDDRLEDLETALERKLVKIATSMAEEEKITSEGAKRVFDILNGVFGLGGSIDKMMEGFEKRLARRIQIEVAIQEAWSSLGTSSESAPPPPIPTFREGGSMVAHRPTIAQFGEVPELVTFTPLADLDRVTQQTKSVGILEIQVTADDNFSPAFEDQLIHTISEFVGKAMVH